MGRLAVAAMVLAISVLGVAVSFGVPRRPAASPKARFPWHGPIDTFRQLGRIRRDGLMSVAVAADVFVWSIGAVLMQLVTVLVIEQFGFGERGKAVAGYMVAMVVVGIALGGILGSRLAVGKRWHRVLPIGALSMSVILLLMGGVPMLPVALHLPASFGLMGLAGVAGGMYLVPCEGFIQTRAADGRKGTVLASISFVGFIGILLSGPVANVLVAVMRPSSGFAVMGLASLLFGLWLLWALGERE